MPFLVDGHNLIPHLPGLSLGDPDDEMKLVERLRSFAARSKRRITVYFDRGAPGTRPGLGGGGVTVRFVASPSTADEGIHRHLRRLAGEARNWTVVSSDGEVRRSAENAGARWLSAPAFARWLSAPRERASGLEKPEGVSDPAELALWMELFSEGERRRPRRRR